MSVLNILYLTASLALVCLPIKLSLTYIFLSPALLIFLYLVLKKEIKIEKKYINLFFPLFIFYFILILNSPIAINGLEAFTDSLKALIYSLTILLYGFLIDNFGFKKIALPLAIGFTFSSIKSIQESIYVYHDKDFAGPLSLAGQLAIGLSFFVIYLNEKKEYLNLNLFEKALPLIILILATGVVTSQNVYLKLSFASLLIISIIFIAIKSYGVSLYKSFPYLLYTLTVPIMLALLIISLKRGPLIGFISAVFIYSIIYRPKFSILIVITSATLFFFNTELQERFLSSINHFFIRGGRYEIWSIGIELLGRYPLGLGFSSSEFLQNFSLNVPLNLNHFHNNFLNIIIECGWIAFSLLVWFFIKLVKIVINQKSILSICALFSFICMQIAGLFEYNFGDSEVLLTCYFFLGATLHIENDIVKTKSNCRKTLK